MHLVFDHRTRSWLCRRVESRRVFNGKAAGFQKRGGRLLHRGVAHHECVPHGEEEEIIGAVQMRFIDPHHCVVVAVDFRVADSGSVPHALETARPELERRGRPPDHRQ